MHSLFLLISILFSTGAFCQTGQKAAENKQDEASQEELIYSRPVQTYESGGRRDPFESLVEKQVQPDKVIKGLFRYENSQIKGVVITSKDAYALVQDSNGLAYVLREGYRVQGGVVRKITPDSVNMYIVKYGRAMSITLMLEGAKSLIIEETVSGTSVRRPGINIDFHETGEIITGDASVGTVTVPSLSTKPIGIDWLHPRTEDEESTQDDQVNGDEESIQEKPTEDIQFTRSVPPGDLEAVVDSILKAESEYDWEQSVPPAPQFTETAEKATSFFVLRRPENGASVSLPILLDWSSETGPGASYTLIIDQKGDFSSPVLIKKGIRTSSYFLTERENLKEGKFYWKVISESSGRSTVCANPGIYFTITRKDGQ